MIDWLPPSVTGPRNHPTGFTGSYFGRRARTELPQLIAAFGNTLRTAELGLVFAKSFRDEIIRFADTGNRRHLSALAFTALTESWLRTLSEVSALVLRRLEATCGVAKTEMPALAGIFVAHPQLVSELV